MEASFQGSFEKKRLVDKRTYEILSRDPQPTPIVKLLHCWPDQAEFRLGIRGDRMVGSEEPDGQGKRFLEESDGQGICFIFRRCADVKKYACYLGV